MWGSPMLFAPGFKPAGRGGQVVWVKPSRSPPLTGLLPGYPSWMAAPLLVAFEVQGEADVRWLDGPLELRKQMLWK